MAKISLPPCPLCQNNSHTLIKKRCENNRVFGPGYSSRVVDFVFYCGVHSIVFVDIRKEASANCADYEDSSSVKDMDQEYLEKIKNKLKR